METPALLAISQRRREESRTVPEDSTRFAGRPVIFWATMVRTSQGLVTSMMIALGATDRMFGSSFSRIATFAPASSRRGWPGFWRAPAVMITMSQSRSSSMSSPPVTVASCANIAPCAMSSASACARLPSMSYRTISSAEPRTIAAYAVALPTPPAPMTPSLVGLLTPFIAVCPLS